MPILSYLHQLFNADTCNTYLHTLRWKERPLHCPRCHSHDVGLWSNYYYRPGLKHYWCHGCRRTFNDLTHTLLAQTRAMASSRDSSACHLQNFGPLSFELTIVLTGARIRLAKLLLAVS